MAYTKGEVITIKNEHGIGIAHIYDGESFIALTFGSCNCKVPGEIPLEILKSFSYCPYCQKPIKLEDLTDNERCTARNPANGGRCYLKKGHRGCHIL